MFLSFSASSLNKNPGLILQITWQRSHRFSARALFPGFYLLFQACWDCYLKKCVIKGFINPLNPIENVKLKKLQNQKNKCKSFTCYSYTRTKENKRGQAQISLNWWAVVDTRLIG